MTSFLETVDSYLNFIPDFKPQGISEQIQLKCSVLYFPLQLPLTTERETTLVSEDVVVPSFAGNVATAQQ